MGGPVQHRLGGSTEHLLGVEPGHLREGRIHEHERRGTVGSELGDHDRLAGVLHGRSDQPQLLLGRALLRHVVDRADVPGDDASRIRHRGRTSGDPSHLAVGMQEAVLRGELDPVRHRRRPLPEDPLPVVGVQRVRPAGALRCGRVHAGSLAPAFVHERAAPLGIGLEDPHRRAVGEGTEAGKARLQEEVRLDAVGDVEHHPLEEPGTAEVVAARQRGLVVDPDRPAVPVHVAELLRVQEAAERLRPQCAAPGS